MLNELSASTSDVHVAAFLKINPIDRIYKLTRSDLPIPQEALYNLKNSVFNSVYNPEIQTYPHEFFIM